MIMGHFRLEDLSGAHTIEKPDGAENILDTFNACPRPIHYAHRRSSPRRQILMTGNRPRTLRAVAMVGVLALIAAACGGDSGDGTTTTGSTDGGPTTTAGRGGGATPAAAAAAPGVVP